MPVLGGEEQRERERASGVFMWEGAWEGDCDGGEKASIRFIKD